MNNVKIFLIFSFCLKTFANVCNNYNCPSLTDDELRRIIKKVQTFNKNKILQVNNYFLNISRGTVTYIYYTFNFYFYNFLSSGQILF